MTYIDHVGAVDVEMLLDILENSEYYDNKTSIRKEIFENRELLEAYIEHEEDPIEVLNREIEKARDELITELTDEIYRQIRFSEYDEGEKTYDDIWCWLDDGSFEGMGFENLLVEYIGMLKQAKQEVE